jgi:hypothetical protein
MIWLAIRLGWWFMFAPLDLMVWALTFFKWDPRMRKFL